MHFARRMFLRNGFLSLSLTAVALFPASLAAHADPVTITGGSFSAALDGTTAPGHVGSNGGAGGGVSSLISESQTKVTLSPTSIGFSFDQILGSAADFTTGSANVNFTALEDSLYTIRDVLPTNTSPDASGFTTLLKDDTTSTWPYITFSGDSLTGVLIAGDTYTFGSVAAIENEVTPEVLYTPSITFSPNVVATTVTPEPSSLMLLGTGLLGACGSIGRKFRNA